MSESKMPSFQSYALQMLMSGKTVSYDFSELQSLRFEVSKMGNNINQLAKAAHIYHQVSPSDIEELTSEMKNLKERMNEELKAIYRKRKEG